MTPTENREAWLRSVADRMAPTFAQLGHPLPRYRVSVGWPSTGAGSSANGECWSDATTADGHFSIFISPAEGDSMAFAAILFHELAHAAVGLQEGHKGAFAKVMQAAGMARPFTSSIAGDRFREWVGPILAELGEIPHSPIRVRGAGAGLKLVKRGPAGVEAAPQQPDGGTGGDAGDESSRPKPQTGRLLKASCSECGYLVRVTAKWLEVGPPHCPAHGPMQTAA